MEFDVRKKLQDDRMRKSQSFGSNCHPSSQSRKISVGIPADKKKPVATEEDEAKIPNTERMNLNKEKSMGVEDKGEGAAASTKGKQSEATEQARSPWISKRFLNRNAPISDTVVGTKKAYSRSTTGGRQKKLNGAKDAQLAHSVQFFANQTSNLKSGDSNQKKFTGITYTMKAGKNGSQEQVEEFTFATAQEAIVSDKFVVADKTENRTETLRTKLWQILGTVSSPKSQPSNSQAHETDANKLKPEQFVDQIGDRLFRPRQNSDTIETDSESPKQPKSRPSTRSLTRKRASTKELQEKTKLGPSSNMKQKYQMKIYSSKEGRPRKLGGAINFGSLMSTRKKSQRKSSIIEPRKISFSEKDGADEPQRASNNCESPRHAEKTSSLGHKEDSFHGCPPKDKRDYFETSNNIQDRDFHQSSDSKKMNQRGESPASAGTRDHPEGCCNPSSKNVVEPSDDFQSPTFAFKTPTLSPSPCSTPRTVQMEQDQDVGVHSPVLEDRRFSVKSQMEQDVDVHSPVLEDRRFSVKSIPSFMTPQTSKPDCSGSDAETDSSEDAEELQDFSPKKPSSVTEKEDAEDYLAEFSSEDGDPRSSNDGSPIIKGNGHGNNSAELNTTEKPNSILCPTKRLRNHRDITVDFSPPLPSPKGMRESDWFQEPSEQTQDDELARAVTIFAFALENFRRKMDSAMKKKSFEILASISEGINLQLQNVQSQILTDIVKLTSLSKSKRKRLETRFEEQQEQLKLIHQKFKGDIHHHLQNCQNTLEVLEAHQIELKGTVKKQRTSHQKLILQVEEAVQTQLNDAQRRITTIHESARKKMLQLKHVIAECLKEGIKETSSWISTECYYYMKADEAPAPAWLPNQKRKWPWRTRQHVWNPVLFRIRRRTIDCQICILFNSKFIHSKFLRFCR